MIVVLEPGALSMGRVPPGASALSRILTRPSRPLRCGSPRPNARQPLNALLHLFRRAPQLCREGGHHRASRLTLEQAKAEQDLFHLVAQLSRDVALLIA
jgi:hypothetical protein